MIDNITNEITRIRQHLACLRVARALMEIRWPQVAEYAFDDGVGVHLCYLEYCMDIQSPLKIEVKSYGEGLRTMTTRAAADMLREDAA